MVDVRAKAGAGYGDVGFGLKRVAMASAAPSAMIVSEMETALRAHIRRGGLCRYQWRILSVQGACRRQRSTKPSACIEEPAYELIVAFLVCHIAHSVIRDSTTSATVEPLEIEHASVGHLEESVLGFPSQSQSPA